MEADINRIIRREFPEIAAGYHLPILGRIEAVTDAPVNAAISDAFRPHFAADIVVLDKQRRPVKDLPIYKAIPLPVPFAGLERGHFAMPEPGSLCEIAFMYGMADQMVIRQVFGLGLSMQSVLPGEVISQAGPDVYDKTDARGNKSRITHGNILDESLLHRIKALELRVDAVHMHETIKGNRISLVTGTLRQKAMGAIRFLSGGVLNLAAVDNINLSTASDMKSTVAGMAEIAAGSSKATITGKAELAAASQEATITGEDKVTAGSRKVTTSGKQEHESTEFIAKGSSKARVESPKVWVGSSSENLLTIISDLSQLVVELATSVSSHQHMPALPPASTMNTELTAMPAAATAIKARVDLIKE